MQILVPNHNCKMYLVLVKTQKHGNKKVTRNLEDEKVRGFTSQNLKYYNTNPSLGLQLVPCVASCVNWSTCGSGRETNNE